MKNNVLVKYEVKTTNKFDKELKKPQSKEKI